jgi:PIN domain nuclease of toxin-antitoxin system
MSALLLDTHSLIWYLEKSPRLSRVAHNAIKLAIRQRQSLYVSAISLLAILYLEEKGRLASGTLDRVLQELSNAGSLLVEVPLTASTAQAMRQVPRDQVPDMPDRAIAATAHALGIPLVTADHLIRASSTPTLW